MLFNFNIWSQNSFTGSIIYLDINNSGSNSSYDLSSSGGTDFHNADLGTFEIGTSDLKLTGVQHNVRKCGGSNINGTELWYRIYSTDESGDSFTNFLTSWTSEYWDGCTNQTWQTTSQDIDLLNGLSNGTYYLEVYGKGWGTEDFYDNNGGSNYRATFRVGSFTSADGDWGTATNWSNNTLPSSSDNVVIKHDLTISSDITAGKVEINSSKSISINAGSSLTVTGELNNSGTVTLNSNSDDFSSLIAGSKAGSGTYKYNRFVESSSTADLISSPFAGETFSNLLSNNSGKIITNPNDATEYLFSSFDQTAGDYSNFDSDTDGSNTINAGTGYRAGARALTSSLFFSQYGEGSSNHKFLEIYNGTGSTVNLNNYAFPNVSNAPDNVGEYEYWNSFTTDATIAHGDVYVIAHPAADATILAEADQTHYYLSNGDDGFKLVSGGTHSDTNGNGSIDAGEMSGFTVVDVMGDWQGDPGSGWAVAGTSNATKDKTLTRKSSVASGNTNWTNSSGTNTSDSEWLVGAQNSGWSELGSHVIDGTTLTFTGVFLVANQTQNISIISGNANGKWNLIGNPFPSYLDLSHFFSDNTALFDGTYGSVYAYDGDDSDGSIWTEYNADNSTGNYIAPGQGFFVAAGGSGSVSFDTDMQSVSGTDNFISGDNFENNNVILRILVNNIVDGSTKLIFRENLNLGLDPGWDSGSYSQSASIMTRLVEDDEGHGLSINAMSTSAMENAVIPLVINQAAGQEFRINLHTATIPDPNVYLEDVEEGTFTNLYEGDFVYTPTSDLSGAGRFFIHMTADTMSNGEVSTSMLNAYKEIDASYITIEGLATQSNETKVSLYNILGREVLATTLNNNMGTQTISTVGLSAGIYVIELESGSDRLTKKLLIQ